MGTLLQDLRFALRVLAKSPGFAIVAVMALALGIGANTAIFSIIDAVLLRSLPYGDPDQLVRVSQTQPTQNAGANSGQGGPTSPANFVDWKTQNQSFSDMAAYSVAAFSLLGQREPERVIGSHITPNVFGLLKVKPLLGRTLLPEDGKGAAEAVVVVSQGFWQRHFGSDPHVLGSSLNLDGSQYRLVGVMPAEFTFGKDAQLWVPLVFTPQDLANRNTLYLEVVARLLPGVALGQAKANMTAVAHNIVAEASGTGLRWDVVIVPLKEQAVGNLRATLYILLGAVGFVLLVACANVANLLLARAAQRTREIAVRTAMGASRRRLIRQTLTESVVLGFLGGAFGLVLAFWSLSLLVRFNPGNIPRLEEVGIDAWVLVFTLAVSLLTGIAFGLLPAFQVSKTDLQRGLKDSGAQALVHHRYRLRDLLVISEIALTLVLLIGAGLMIRSFQLLEAVDPGFNPDHVLTLRMTLPLGKYPQESQRSVFFQDVLERVRQIPQVKSDGLVTSLPLEGGELRQLILIEGRPLSPDEPLGGGMDVVSPDYFRTMGIPVLKGRYFTPLDRQDAPPVVIIDESMAREYWPDKDPIGQRVMIPGVKPVYREIVGVVRGLKFFGLEQERRPTMYVPLLQYAGERTMSLVVKTQSDPSRMAAALRGAVWSVDRDQTVSTAVTMEQMLARSVAQRRFNTGIIEVFALVALLLAIVGIHGVLSYSVAQRTREIGIRMALGAERRRVLLSVLGQALSMVGVGVVIGIVASIGLTRLIASMLYGVGPLDLRTYLGMSALLVLVALVASYIPARRATKVDPLVALKYD